MDNVDKYNLVEGGIVNKLFAIAAPLINGVGLIMNIKFEK